jgi:type I restriction enzyme S subunit
MRKGWQTRKLADLLEVQNGYAFSSKNYSESGHFLMRIGNVQNGYISTADPKFIKLPTDGSLQRFVLSEDDILVSLTGNVGRVGVIKAEHLPAALNQRVAKISIRKDSSATRELLLLFLCSDWFREELIGAGHGAAQQNVSTKDLVEIEIPIPPLPEQQRIVGVLDEAFEGLATAKANAEKNLQNARALFESHLQSIFTKRGKGWVETTIGEEIRFIDYRGKTPVKTASGIRLITAKNVKMGYLLDTPMEFIAADNYESWMTRGIPKKGDVLFTTEAPLANVAQLDTDEKVAFAQRIIIMQPNAVKLDATFLKYLLLSQPVQERIRGKGTGATVQGIKASLLKTIEISFPNNIAEQKQIAAKLHGLAAETQRLAAIYEQKLAALEALKKSLLHQAFSGNL